MTKPPFPSNPKKSRLWFKKHGISITDWCRENDLKKAVVTDLLRGKLKGDRGHAHKAAIALGLKEDPNKKSRAA